jgi:hypothetical protein
VTFGAIHEITRNNTKKKRQNTKGMTHHHPLSAS